MVTREIKKQIIKKNLMRRCYLWVLRGFFLPLIIAMILSIFARSISSDAWFIIAIIMMFIIPVSCITLYAKKREGDFVSNFKEFCLIFWSTDKSKEFKNQIEKDDISNMKEILIENKLTSNYKIQQLINYFEKFLLQKTEFQLVTFLIPFLIPLFMTIALFAREFDDPIEMSEGLLLIVGAIGSAIIIIFFITNIRKFIVNVFLIEDTINKIIVDVLNEILLMHDLEKCNKENELVEVNLEETVSQDKIEDQTEVQGDIKGNSEELREELDCSIEIVETEEIKET